MRHFPLRFGARDRTREQEQRAILGALSDGFDTTDPALLAETRAEAHAVAMIRHANKRSANQLVPTRLLESLRIFEEACGLRPSPRDSGAARRARVAARLVGATGNGLADIATVARHIMGECLVALLLAPEEITYWPGVNPGPPGFEFTSNRAIVCVQLQRAGVTDEEFERRHRELLAELDEIRPSWMVVITGEGSECICDEGIADVAIV